jgi:hypothetical protein
LYQRLQCRDKYFFKIKFVFFLYLRLSVSSKENDLPLCIYFWDQRDSGVPNTSIYSAVSLASPYYNYLSSTASTTMICWCCHSNSVNTEVACRFVQKSRQEQDRAWSELTWFETTVLRQHHVHINSSVGVCIHHIYVEGRGVLWILTEINNKNSPTIWIHYYLPLCLYFVCFVYGLFSLYTQGIQICTYAIVTRVQPWIVLRFALLYL